MNTLQINNRPFASEMITGLMLPDGIFESTLGRQRINIHLGNAGGSSVNGAEVFFESASHPAITVAPRTYPVNTLQSNASRLYHWDADFTNVPAGKYFVSFIAKTPAGEKRIIKKIFVTKIQFDPSTGLVHATVPEGQMSVHFMDLVQPRRKCCHSGKRQDPKKDFEALVAFARSFNNLSSTFKGHTNDFRFCSVGYLPLRVDTLIQPTPPFPGQYGDLPYQDPWWKVVLAIVAALLLIGAAIAEAVDGTGSVSPGAGGTFDETTGDVDCCSPTASGGGSSYVAAGLVAAAAAVATIAAASDKRDPYRRGQDHTHPAEGELTTGEKLYMEFKYPEPVVPGKPFAVGLDWKYTRLTTGESYTYSASDQEQNIHVLSEYHINAPEVIRLYKREPFIVKASFIDEDGKQLKGDQLFAQCFLCGPNGEYDSFVLQDDGNFPDDDAYEGTYTGIYWFNQKEKPQGLWKYFVIAQDVNLDPEDAAQIIGGMVLTSQLKITFNNDECEFVPDGHVNVIV